MEHKSETDTDVDRVSPSGEKQENAVSWDPEEERKLVRKVDIRLFPTAWIMFLISWMDRSNLGNAKMAGLSHDLGLSSSDYSMSIIVFYFGYVVCAPLSNTLLVRTKPSIYLAGLMLLWGISTCGMAAIQTYPQLLVLRVFVGIFESGLAPAMYFMISSWFVPEEQAKRGALFMSSAMLGGGFGGIIAGAVTDALEGKHGIRGWRWLFLVEGVITVGWALVAGYLLPDFPPTCHYITEHQRVIALRRLRNAGVEMEGKAWNRSDRIGIVKSVLLALSDWRTWAVSTGVTLSGCATVLPYFYPTLVTELGYKDRVKAQYMTVPIWAAAFICTLVTGVCADRIPGYRALFMAGWLIVGCALTAVVCNVYDHLARYVVLIFQAGSVWSAITLGIALETTTFKDMRPEVRAVAVSIPGALGNAGNIYGAYLFPAEHAPKYLMGFGVITGTLGGAAVIFAAIQVLLRKKQRQTESR
ncbi:putative MFS transporter [Podospora australis]|uniref:MFS transporter n=1 Tax=Podospora australis TaxID=1536484 RepID=A0AAN7ABK2_9PEZI|nr:putative MFS transporter [Podospora australis]